MMTTGAGACAIPIDQYQRYNFVRQVIEIVGKSSDRILEVGGAHSPLRLLLPGRRILSLDQDRSDRKLDVLASGLRLPFRDHAFDIVISTDVLEHLPPGNRDAFLNELLRTAGRILILGFPNNTPPVIQAEEILYEHIRNISGIPYPFLAEHRQQGLPDALEIKKKLAPRVADLLDFPNASLRVWLPMMMSYFLLEDSPELHAAREQLESVFNTYLESHSHEPPAYRTFLVCLREPVSPEAREKLLSLKATPEKADATTFADMSLTMAAFFQNEIRQVQRRFRLEAQRLQDHRDSQAQAIREQQAGIDWLQDQIESKEQTIKEREAGLASLRQQLESKEETARQREAELVSLQEQVDARERSIQEQGAQIRNLQAHLNLFLNHPVYKSYAFLKSLFRRKPS